MTKKRRFSLVASCAALAGLGVLAAPTSAEAQCYRPVYAPAYAPVTYVDYGYVPTRTVYVNQPVYAPRAVYVEQPVYVAPRYRASSFNVSLNFGNSGYYRHDGRGSRHQYGSSRYYRNHHQSARRSHNNRRRY